MSAATRVALLDLRARADTFVGDDALGTLGAHLEARGHHAALLRSVRDAFPGPPSAWHDALARFVSAGAFDLVVVARAWDGATLDALRRALRPGARLLRLAPPAAAALDERVDHILDASALLALASLAPREAPRPSVVPPPRDGAARRARAPLPLAPLPTVLAPASLPGEVLPGRPTLTGPATGCPYLVDARGSPLFATLEDPGARLQTRGCTFCLDNTGGYVLPSEASVVASWLAQLRAIRAQDPAAREVLLTDERPHPWLPAFVEALLAEPSLGPVELLFKTRVDWLLEFADTALARALSLCERGGHVLHAYLVGFESFDPFHLELFNKGTTVADNLAAVATLRSLAARFPASFEYRRLRAHGIVLFTPWTAPEALLENARHMRATDFHELRAGALQTRLRLYPGLPLHALAARDDLLAPDPDHALPDRAAEQGYDASVPWRFRDARTEAIWHAVTALAGEHPALREADLLELATRYVLRWPALARTPRDAALPLREALRAWGPAGARGLLQRSPAAAGYDPEIEGITAGTRRACLKEAVSSRDAEALARAYRAMGLAASVTSVYALERDAGNHHRGASHATVAVAASDADLRALSSLHGDRSSTNDRSAVRAMGALMGYPACCVDAFAALPDRGDNLANERHAFLRAPAEALHPLAHRLGRFRLASHHLCTPACAATVARAEAVLVALGALDPTLPDFVRAEMARPVLFLDYGRRAVLEGRWEGERFTVATLDVLDGDGFAPLAAVELDAATVTLLDASGRARVLDAPAPLLTTPGTPLAPAALRALAKPAPAPSLPGAFRPGARARDFAVVTVDPVAGGHRLVLEHGDERVGLCLRAHDPSRPATVRRGRWAIDVDSPERLSVAARAAVSVVVRALPP